MNRETINQMAMALDAEMGANFTQKALNRLPMLMAIQANLHAIEQIEAAQRAEANAKEQKAENVDVHN